MAGQPVVSRSHENAAATHVYHYRDAAMDVLSLEKRDPLPPSSIARLFWMHGSSDDVCPRCWRILDSTAGDLSRTLSDFGTRRISEDDTFQRSQRESRHVDNRATRNSNFTWECKISRRSLNRLGTLEYSHVNVVRHVLGLSFFSTMCRLMGHAENRNFCSDSRTLSFSQAESFLRGHARARSLVRERSVSTSIGCDL